MTTLIFVRHCEAEGNVERNFHGYFDSHLTPNGLAQRELLQARFRDLPFDVIYSSDLRRAYMTAEAIANGRDVIKLPGLREINGGKWENTPWEELPRLYPESYTAWLTDPEALQMPDGESMVGFQRRLVQTVEGIIKDNDGRTVVMVSHGTAIKMLLCHFYNRPIREFINMKWHDNASITIVEYHGGRYNIILEGDNEHLGELSTLNSQTWWREGQA